MCEVVYDCHIAFINRYIGNTSEATAYDSVELGISEACVGLVCLATLVLFSGVDIRFQKWPDIMSDHIGSRSDMV